jgi:hypothetical protein
MGRERTAGRLTGAAIVAALFFFPLGAARAQGIPPEDANCVSELGRAIGEFTSSGLEDVLAERIDSGGSVEPDPQRSDDLREAILEACSSIPSVADAGECGGLPSVSSWADCVVATQEAALLVLVDALLGPAPTPTPRPTATPTATSPVQPGRCARRFEPCTGPGIRGCCPGLECRFVGGGDPFCVVPSEPPSPSGAFLDGEEARAF